MSERGGIRVDLRADRLEGTTGVVANVASFLTGATHDTGFKGIGGNFDRRGLLFFGVDVAGQMRFTRVDAGAAATVSARLDRVPADPRMALVLQRGLAATATADETAQFQSLWQGEVRKLLLKHADDPDIIVVDH